MPRKQVKDRSKEFPRNRNNMNKKRWFLEKATGHNDHYVINIGSQRVFCSTVKYIKYIKLY